MVTRTFRASAPLALLGFSRENFPSTLIATGNHLFFANILIRSITEELYCQYDESQTFCG